MVPNAVPPAPPSTGEPRAAGRDAVTPARVPDVGRPCVRAGPAPKNAIIAATTPMRPIDPIEVAPKRMRSASGSTVMLKFVINRSNQRD
jgi:hypothetical protein